MPDANPPYPGKTLLEMVYDLINQAEGLVKCIADMQKCLNDEKVERMKGDSDIQHNLTVKAAELQQAISSLQLTITQNMNTMEKAQTNQLTDTKLLVRELVVKVTFYATLITGVITTILAIGAHKVFG